MAKAEKVRVAVAPAPREPWYNHWLVGVALIVGALFVAWLLAGAPPIMITGW